MQRVTVILRYDTTLNAIGKSKFHLVGNIYSVIRAQRAKLKYILGVVRTLWLGGVVFRTLDLRPSRRWFKSRS